MNDSINNVYAYRNLSYIEKMARHEYVSSLYVYDLKEGRSDLFFKNLASCECVIAEGRKASIYSGMGQDLDIRSKNWFETPAGSATEYVNKYMRGTQIPLLKLSEMYLIAAEARGGYPLSGNLAGQSGICYRSATGRGEFYKTR